MLGRLLIAVLSFLATALDRYAQRLDSLEYEPGVWYPYHWMD